MPDSDFQEDMSHRIMNKSDRFECLNLFEVAPSATGYPIKNYKLSLERESTNDSKRIFSHKN